MTPYLHLHYRSPIGQVTKKVIAAQSLDCFVEGHGLQLRIDFVSTAAMTTGQVSNGFFEKAMAEF
jgi:hypothetical protein